MTASKLNWTEVNAARFETNLGGGSKGVVRQIGGRWFAEVLDNTGKAERLGKSRNQAKAQDMIEALQAPTVQTMPPAVAEMNRTPELAATTTERPAEKPKRRKPKARKVEGEVTIAVHQNGKAFTSKRPGVCAKIIEVLANAGESNPVTKTEILKQLVDAFPDRQEAKMKATVMLLVPSGLWTYNKIKVRSSKPEGFGEKGYWVEKLPEVYSA